MIDAILVLFFTHHVTDKVQKSFSQISMLFKNCKDQVDVFMILADTNIMCYLLKNCNLKMP